jgi:DNA-binding MarR family transcriptional regulator
MPTAAEKRASSPRRRASLELGQVEHLIGYQVRRAQLMIYDDFMSGQGSSPMTPGQFSLLLLIDADANATQRELCQKMAVDKSTLTVALDRMSKQGMIKRVRSTVDRRQNGLVLTKKGQSKLTAMRAYVNKHERRITTRLSAPERKQLIALLRKVG